jgi:tyrosyl-tRNA synthetase
VHLEKLLAQTGLAESVSDARRKREAGAVYVDGARHKEPRLPLPGDSGELLIQVGKNWRRLKW